MNYQNKSQIIEGFDSLGVIKYDTRVYKHKEIQVSGYSELFFKIKNALKVVAVAATNELDKQDIGLEIADTLHLISELIPTEEGDLLDKLHDEAIIKEKIKTT